MVVQPEGETKRARVRFVGIDTPEVDFEGYNQGEWALAARDRVRELAPQGSSVRVEVESKDVHGRWLGRIFVGETEINKVLLQEGLAVLYFIDPTNKRLMTEYMALAAEAEKTSRGFIGTVLAKDNLAPYDFRIHMKNQTGLNVLCYYSQKKLHPNVIGSDVPYAERVYFSSKEFAKKYGCQ